MDSTSHFFSSCTFSRKYLCSDAITDLWRNGGIFMTEKKQQIKYDGFTLLEMLVVLLIISVLILLFVTNLSKHKEGVDKKGNEAIVKIIETQIDLYAMEKNQTPTVDQLLQEKYITQEQYDKYQNSK